MATPYAGRPLPRDRAFPQASPVIDPGEIRLPRARTGARNVGRALAALAELRPPTGAELEGAAAWDANAPSRA